MLRRCCVALTKPLAVGDLAVGAPRSFSDDEVRAFLAAAGDANTVHDADAASGDVVLPGMLVASLISGVMGTSLPGPGSVYLSQTLKFRKKALLSNSFHAVVEVKSLSPARNLIQMHTSVLNEEGEVVVDGDALGQNRTPSLWSGGATSA